LNFRGVSLGFFGVSLRLEISAPSAKVAKLAKVFGLPPSLANLELNFRYPLLTRFPPGDLPRLTAEIVTNLCASLDAAEMSV